MPDYRNKVQAIADAMAPLRSGMRLMMGEFVGELPCTFEGLTGFAGVGPKCANLVLGIACGQPFIGVDVHVHRVTNRWGYVSAKTPEKTLAALEAKLPARHWVCNRDPPARSTASTSRKATSSRSRSPFRISSAAARTTATSRETSPR